MSYFCWQIHKNLLHLLTTASRFITVISLRDWRDEEKISHLTPFSMREFYCQFICRLSVTVPEMCWAESGSCPASKVHASLTSPQTCSAKNTSIDTWGVWLMRGNVDYHSQPLRIARLTQNDWSEMKKSVKQLSWIIRTLKITSSNSTVLFRPLQSLLLFYSTFVWQLLLLLFHACVSKSDGLKAETSWTENNLIGLAAFLSRDDASS